MTLLNKSSKFYQSIIALFIIGISLSFTSLAQSQQQRFNRFQYHKYKWRTFHTKAFSVYFPTGYDSVGSFVVRELPFAMKKVKHDMVTTLLKEPNIIVYPSPDQFYESNIGSFETSQFSFPTFMAKGNRIVLFYNGNYQNLKVQLYEALVRSVWEEQLKEDGVLKGTIVESKIPYWFKEGAIKYFAHKWPIESEDALKRSFEQNGFKSWQQSISYQPKLSGQAFCYFLTERYYSQAGHQLFGQLKKKPDLRRSIRLIAKRPLDTLMKQCFSFYKERFSADRLTDAPENTDSLTIPHKRGIVRGVLLSPKQDYIAYVLYAKGKRTIYTYDINTAKTHKLTSYQLPPWLSDHSQDHYPLLTWDDDGTQLFVTMPVKGKMRIMRYAVDGHQLQKNWLVGTDGIKGMVSLSSKEHLMAAYTKGQSDIVGYNTNRDRYIPNNSDSYDDADPAIGNSKSEQILFRSFRPDRPVKRGDTIKLKQGIYSLHNKTISPLLVDSVAYIKWDKPVYLNNSRLLVTHTKSGTENFALISNLAMPGSYKTLSAYQPYQYIASSNQVSFYKFDKDSIRITKENIDQWIVRTENEEATSPWLADYQKRAAEEARIDSMLRAAKDDTPSFLEGVLMPKDAKQKSQRREDSISKSLAFNPKKIRPYVLQLHSAYFTAKVNNDYFINRYQPYLNYQGQFKFPEIGGMVQGGFTDLLENHHINIAFRLPAGTEGSDFFFKYENTTKKLDWGVTYFRKVESLQPDPKKVWKDETGRRYPASARVKTHYYEVSMSYPITYDLSASMQTAIRQDRTIFLATEKYSLTFPDIKSMWVIASPSLTWNKLKPTVPFLFRGFKGKILFDVFKGFTQQEEMCLGSQLHVEYHKPIFKYITAVVQAKAGYSTGGNRILYNLGGTDNNVVPKIDSNIQFDQTAPYAFQTLITPFRGHLQNKLYGDRYALANADIYFPIFQTLIPIETPLQAVNLLQLGIFADAAIAQESWNKSAKVNDPLWSYGLSARTSLAGYPIRLDVAWPGTFDAKPVWYFSLNLK